MSKKILPFPLNMKNGAKVRTIEDLQTNADIDSILGFYLDGKLSRWCQAFRYEELPPKIDGITEASIRKLYEILGISINEDELKTFLENNVALQSGTKSGSSDEETEVVDSGEIKSQLEKFVDKEINLSDYAIETSPIINEDGKVNEYKISIKNEKAKIYQSFFLPYSVNNDDDKKTWNNNLIKKISHGIKNIGEIKSQLEKFVDKEINLSDYAIETSPIINEDGKITRYKIVVKNTKDEIYQSFFLPYSVNNDDDKKAWNENLIKKISHGIKNINEIVTYNGKYYENTTDDDFVFIEDNNKTSAFYICDHQVTQKEWQDIMGNNPSRFKGDNRPVEQVSWYDAIEYCNKRSEKEGLTPCYSGNGDDIKCDFNANGYRLSTKAEWTYAARGGNKSGGYRYSGSNNIDEVAWYAGNSGCQTHDVKQKKPNELGIYDMSGNVFEWSWEWYWEWDRYWAWYESSPKSSKDYAAPSLYPNRIFRGGSCCNNEEYCDLSNGVVHGDPAFTYALLGFRVVRSKRD